MNNIHTSGNAGAGGLAGVALAPAGAADAAKDEYRYGFHDPEEYVYRTPKGLTRETVEEISRRKDEPEWMLEKRLEGLRLFQRKPMPRWGATLHYVEGCTALGLGPPVGRTADPRRRGLVSFNVEGIHAHDVGCVLDAEGVAVRTGHMCSQPALRHLGIESCVRASFALYNGREDLDRLSADLEKTVEFFKAR